MHILFADESFLAESWWIWLIALLLLIGVACVFRYFFFFQVPLWILTHTIYRVRPHGVDNIPATGPALLVALLR